MSNQTNTSISQSTTTTFPFTPEPWGLFRPLPPNWGEFPSRPSPPQVARKPSEVRKAEPFSMW